MDERQVSLAVSSVVRLCFDTLGHGEWKGRLHTRYHEAPIRFENASELLERMDQFYDWLDFPQASTKVRSFRELKAQTVTSNQRDHVIVTRQEDMDKQHGDKATFVVRVQYRQNATWQGQVTWTEENKTVAFRSALELLKLIDSTASDETGAWEQE